MRDGNEPIDPDDAITTGGRAVRTGALIDEVWAIRRVLININKAVDPHYGEDEHIVRSILEAHINILQKRIHRAGWG